MPRCVFSRSQTPTLGDSHGILNNRARTPYGLQPRPCSPHQRAPRNSLFSLSVAAEDDGTEEAVDCTGDSWRYQAADGEWKTELSFPATWESSDVAPMVYFEGFFNATGDGEVTVSGIPTSIAPAVSDSLYGRNIELALTCNQEDPVVVEEDSCVLFQVEFTNYSPTFDVNMALFRFEGKSSACLDLSVLRIPSAREKNSIERNTLDIGAHSRFTAAWSSLCFKVNVLVVFVPGFEQRPSRRTHNTIMFVCASFNDNLLGVSREP